MLMSIPRSHQGFYGERVTISIVTYKMMGKQQQDRIDNIILDLTDLIMLVRIKKPLDRYNLNKMVNARSELREVG